MKKQISAILYSILFIGIAHAQNDPCDFELFQLQTLAIAQCMGNQVKTGKAEVQVQTQAIEKAIQKTPTNTSSITKNFLSSDSLWQKHMEAECFLDADIDYPDYANAETPRLNDQEKGLAIAGCLLEQIQFRKAYLNSLWLELLKHQAQQGFAALQRQTKAFAAATKKANLHAELPQLDSLWQRHVEIDCALSASVAQQDPGIALATCQLEQIQLRQKYLDQLSQSLH